MTATQECTTITPFDSRATLGIGGETLDRAQTKGTWGAGVRVLSWAEWMEEGRRLFGPDRQNWAFRCPACGCRQNALDFIRRRIDPRGRVFMTCFGRFLPVSEDPWVIRCRFSLEGLPQFSRVVVVYEGREIPVFEYAEPQSLDPFNW